jgi:hypothetical protein
MLMVCFGKLHFCSIEHATHFTLRCILTTGSAAAVTALQPSPVLHARGCAIRCMQVE